MHLVTASRDGEPYHTFHSEQLCGKLINLSSLLTNYARFAFIAFQELLSGYFKTAI
jgi:hypothetical protein